MIGCGAIGCEMMKNYAMLGKKENHEEGKKGKGNRKRGKRDKKGKRRKGR